MPLLRVWKWPTKGSAAASSGSFSSSCGHAISLFCVTAAPISMMLPRSLMTSSAASREISISAAGIDQPQIEHRQERLAAGENARVVAIFGKQRQHLLDRIGPHVIEGARFHVFLASNSAWMRRGVAGSTTSRSDSASAMALAMQAGVDMQLPSARPLAPSGVNGDGDS